MLKTLPHLALQILILTEQRPGLKESMKGSGVDNETKNEYENYVLKLVQFLKLLIFRLIRYYVNN